VNGKAGITSEISVALENVFGTPATYWQRLQSSYDSFIARQRIEQEIEKNREWINYFDYKNLVNSGVVKPERNYIGKGKELFRFFEVKDYDAWDKTWLTPATEIYCRSTTKARDSSDQRIIARLSSWIRIGQIQVEEHISPTFPKYNREILKSKINVIRDLNLLTEPERMTNRLRDVLETAGVFLNVLPAQPGMNTYAATFMVQYNSVACIQVSLRGKTHDQLWFSLFHEIYHLLNRGNNQGFFIGGHCNEKEESEADKFAADILINPNPYKKYTDKMVFTELNIKNFAVVNNVHPGIVVGRLQHDNFIGFQSFNQLKVRYQFKES